MGKNGGGKGGSKGGGGGSKGGPGKGTAGFPSTTENPSGTGRDNNPPAKK